MARRLAYTCLVALGFAAADLLVKALAPTQAWDFHQRSHGWAIFALCLLAVVLALGLLPSRAVVCAAGLVGGGVLGNVVSALRHGGRVPNPIVVGTVALNAADVFVLVGVPALVVALAGVTIRHRATVDRLIPPRRWERSFRRRLGL